MALSIPQLLIDSGASASVCGRSWVRKWLSLAGIKTFPKMSKSSKSFRFGNQCTYPSEGVVYLNGRVDAFTADNRAISIYLSFSIDIINLDLPFLLSRQALASLQSRIDFVTNEILLPKKVRIPLTITPGGHISCRWFPHSRSVVLDTSEKNEAFHVNAVSEPSMDIDAPSLLKIHKQLGHASAATISRVCRRAGETFSEASLLQTICDCGCGRIESAPQVPRVNRYQSTVVGEAVFLT